MASFSYYASNDLMDISHKDIFVAVPQNLPNISSTRSVLSWEKLLLGRLALLSFSLNFGSSVVKASLIHRRGPSSRMNLISNQRIE